MILRRALFIAACVSPLALGAASAQQTFQPVPQTPQAQQEPPCVQEFAKLRDDAQKKALAIRNASQRKASPKEACHLFNVFSAAEGKMLKYAQDNAVWCGIPKQVIDTIKKSHGRTDEIRTKVCRVAAAPPRPTAPTLSDALTAPIPNANNIKSGHGTFDTLTGPAIGSK